MRDAGKKSEPKHVKGDTTGAASTCTQPHMHPPLEKQYNTTGVSRERHNPRSTRKDRIFSACHRCASGPAKCTEDGTTWRMVFHSRCCGRSTHVHTQHKTRAHGQSAHCTGRKDGFTGSACLITGVWKLSLPFVPPPIPHTPHIHIHPRTDSTSQQQAKQGKQGDPCHAPQTARNTRGGAGPEPATTRT